MNQILMKNIFRDYVKYGTKSEGVTTSHHNKENELKKTLETVTNLVETR